MKLSEAKQLRNGDYITHKTMTNTTGRVNARVNGTPKTWKTRPDAIRIPCKYGLYEYFQLGQGNTDKPIDQSLEDWEVGYK